MNNLIDNSGFWGKIDFVQISRRPLGPCVKQAHCILFWLASVNPVIGDQISLADCDNVFQDT